jgi:RND superfamily putative drug exporter
VIRGVVVPAFLRVAGDLNWWAPAPLKWLHARIGFSEAPPAALIPPPMSVSPEPSTAAFTRPAVAASEVAVIPGRHLVANVNGTVVVVAHRGPAPLSPQSVAARQMSALVEIVRRTDRRRLASAVSQLSMASGAAGDFGIVVPTAAGLDVYLWGAVTLVLDDGRGRTVLHGAAPPLLVHRSVPVPAVSAVVTVDETGERPHRTGLYLLGAGIAPGAGAVISSTQATSATTRLPVVAPPPRGDLAPTASTVPIGRVRRANRAERDELPHAATRPISPRLGFSPPQNLNEPMTRPLTPEPDGSMSSSEITRGIDGTTRPLR